VKKKKLIEGGVGRDAALRDSSAEKRGREMGLGVSVKRKLRTSDIAISYSFQGLPMPELVSSKRFARNR
jgi:hypothetical protein